MTDPRKTPAAADQPTQAELDEPLAIDAAPDELGAAVMDYQPPERSDD